MAEQATNLRGLVAMIYMKPSTPRSSTTDSAPAVLFCQESFVLFRSHSVVGLVLGLPVQFSDSFWVVFSPLPGVLTRAVLTPASVAITGPLVTVELCVRLLCLAPGAGLHLRNIPSLDEGTKKVPGAPSSRRRRGHRHLVQDRAFQGPGPLSQGQLDLSHLWTCFIKIRG